LSKKRILVVDDDESLRWVTQAQLQQNGYDVAAAADVVSALEQIRNSPPDLVITDLKMPGLSGLDLLKATRAEFPEIIVIMVTAFGTVENAVEAMKAGAYDYITKPVNVEELRLVVNRGLEHLDRFREHPRAVQQTAVRARYGGARGPGHVNRFDPRRDGHRQGVARPGGPFQQPSQGQAFRHD
jgi:two-component system NtrC family response regulator